MLSIIRKVVVVTMCERIIVNVKHIVLDFSDYISR